MSGELTVWRGEAELVVAPAAGEASPAQAYLVSLASRRSRDTMAWALRKAAELLGLDPKLALDAPWHQLDVATLAALRTRLAGELAPNSANTVIAAIRGVIKWAWRQGKLTADQHERLRDVAQDVAGERVRQGRALVARDQLALLEAAAAEPSELRAARDVALAAVLLGCGLRRAEACALTTSSYQPGLFDGQGGLVVMGKGNRQAAVPLPSNVSLLLQAWLELRGAEPGPLFPVVDPSGRRWVERPMSEANLYALVAKWADLAGLGPVKPHDLRRTYGTALFNAGHDLGLVQKLMRHKRPETTGRYDMRGEAELGRAAQTLNIPMPRRKTK